MPSIVVDDDGVMVVIPWAEVLETLANAKPALLLQALAARLDTPAAEPPRPKQLKRGRNPKGRPAHDGGYAERFTAALADGEWASAPVLAKRMGRVSVGTGMCGSALRQLVKDGTVEVQGRADERQWKLTG